MTNHLAHKFAKTAPANQHQITGQFLQILCAKWFLRIFYNKTDFRNPIEPVSDLNRLLDNYLSLYYKKFTLSYGVDLKFEYYEKLFDSFETFRH